MIWMMVPGWVKPTAARINMATPWARKSHQRLVTASIMLLLQCCAEYIGVPRHKGARRYRRTPCFDAPGRIGWKSAR